MEDAFKPKYLNRQKEKRDRFQVEFNIEERQMALDMARFILQAKDPTNLKQWAFYGWLCKSHPSKAERYFRDVLLKNDRNNKRIGVNVELELEDKIQRLREEVGWKLQ